MSAPVILDASGVPITGERRAAMRVGAYGDTAHKGASWGRELGKWFPGNGSADSDNNAELDTLTARSRDLLRNDAAAIAPIISATNAIVGPGLTFQPAPNWRLLGKSEEWAADWSDEVHAVMAPWFGSTECDASGYGDFDRMTHLVLTSVMMNGGVMALPIWQPDRGMSDWATAMYLVEIDRLRNPNNGMDTLGLSGGVEHDRYGRPSAYHLMTEHPGDAGKPGYMPAWERIPATTDWGRPRAIHVFDRNRVGQSRGLSMLAPVIPNLHMLGRADQAELESALANAMIAFFAQMNLPPEAIMEMFDGPEDLFKFRDGRKLRFAGASQKSAAQIVPLAPGEEVKAHVSNRPNMNWAPFSEGLLRRVYGAMGQAYEIGSKNLGSLNYSGARSAGLETWRTWTTQRVWLVSGWCQPCYRLAFEEAVARGKIRDCTTEDLLSNYHAWTNSTWNGPGKGWVDPVKEAEGGILRVTGLVSTLKDECGDQGRDWRAVLRQQKVERDWCEREGIPYPAAQGVTPPNVNGPGAPGAGRTIEDQQDRRD